MRPSSEPAFITSTLLEVGLSRSSNLEEVLLIPPEGCHFMGGGSALPYKGSYKGVVGAAVIWTDVVGLTPIWWRGQYFVQVM
jgi:hypothetical protein